MAYKQEHTLSELATLAEKYEAVGQRLRAIAEQASQCGRQSLRLKLGTLDGSKLQQIRAAVERVAADATIQVHH